MIYDMKGNENYKLLPDILRRVKTRSSIKSSLNIFDTYDVRNGERPEDIAFKWFGDAELHWVILMTNNVTDRYYGWPVCRAGLGMARPNFACAAGRQRCQRRLLG